MKATYYKDTMHSYMIIPCPPEAETAGYQYRMLEMNRIDGILRCGLRHIDGRGLLYYDTTGKQSLKGLYEGRKISGTELFKLLEMMDRVSGSLSKYLLDEQHLVLTGDQIFYDFSSGQYCFTYYPGEIVKPDVFRFLADSIDGKDKKAAAAAYRLCSVSGDDRQALREAVREEAAMKDAVPPWETAADKLREESALRGAESELPDREAPNGGYGGRRHRKQNPSPGAGESPQELPEKRKAPGKTAGSKTESGRKGMVIRILLIAVLIAGAAGLFAVQLLVYISQRERRLCIAGSILLMICACLITAETIIRVRKKHKEQKEEESRRELYSAMSTLPDDYRNALYLIYFEDMSHEEVAGVMHKSVKQVYNLVFRGKQALKKILEERHGGRIGGEIRVGKSVIRREIIDIRHGLDAGHPVGQFIMMPGQAADIQRHEDDIDHDKINAFGTEMIF